MSINDSTSSSIDYKNSVMKLRDKWWDDNWRLMYFIKTDMRNLESALTNQTISQKKKKDILLYTSKTTHVHELW